MSDRTTIAVPKEVRDEVMEYKYTRRHDSMADAVCDLLDRATEDSN